MIQNKFKKRGTVILLNTVNSIISPFTNILLSIFIIKFSGQDVWGNFVYFFLYAVLFSSLLNWGLKEYSLRQFSSDPSEIHNIWVSNFITRISLIIPLIVFVLILFPFKTALVILIWSILMFCSLSFEPLIVYYKKFTMSVTAEIIPNLFIYSCIFIFRPGLKFILISYFLYYAFRIVFFTLLFKKYIFINTAFKKLYDFSIFKYSAGFFLLGLTGMLGSRADQYIASILLPGEELGKYQVIKNFLLYFQAVSVFVIYPYLKNFYRLRQNSVLILNKAFIAGGFIVVIPSVFFLWFVMNFIYNYSFELNTYIISVFFILPSFIYIIPVYYLYSIKKEKLVLLSNIILILTSFSAGYILIMLYGINGGLITGTITGWLGVILYYLFYLKNRKITATQNDT